MEQIQLVIDNWGKVTQAIAYVIAGASIIVKLTPTLKDNTVLLKIIKVLAKYGALNKNTPLDMDRPL